MEAIVRIIIVSVALELKCIVEPNLYNATKLALYNTLLSLFTVI